MKNLAFQYRRALRKSLAEGGEATLEIAYEVGRMALQEGLGVVDMAAIHHRALEGLIGKPEVAGKSSQILEAAASFFVESLSPFEMTHRGYREAHDVLLHLNETMEGEAKRIAHALHDEAGQLVAVVQISLDNLERDLAPSHSKRLLQVRLNLEEIENQLRQLSHELRPTILDDLGLSPALHFLADGFSKRSRLKIRVKGSTGGRLPPRVEIALYRIVQEALTNVVRHARARQVTVVLHRPGRKVIHCSVQDDGAGFDVSTIKMGKGLGLRGIEERLKALGGSLEIKPSPAGGATLLVQIPLEV